MKKIIKTTLAAISTLILRATAFADTATQTIVPIIPKPANLPGPDASNPQDTIGIFANSILPRFATSFIVILGSLSLVFLLISGVRYAILSNSDEDIEKAKTGAIYSVVGFVIALLAYTIVLIVNNLPLISR